MSLLLVLLRSQRSCLGLSRSCFGLSLCETQKRQKRDQIRPFWWPKWDPKRPMWDQNETQKDHRDQNETIKRLQGLNVKNETRLWKNCHKVRPTQDHTVPVDFIISNLKTGTEAYTNWWKRNPIGWHPWGHPLRCYHSNIFPNHTTMVQWQPHWDCHRRGPDVYVITSVDHPDTGSSPRWIGIPLYQSWRQGVDGTGSSTLGTS